LSRREFSELAAHAGCEVDEGVTKHTTLVVVGVQDDARLNGKKVSNSHQKALDWIRKGKPIRIITENDFNKLLEAAQIS
jgi:DNA polymerase-3 subunit epsilon